MSTVQPAPYVIDPETERDEIIARYKGLLRSLRGERTSDDTRMIRKAFNIAVEAHKEQRRKSGEPYIYHPIEVARICSDEIGLGATSVTAALLHDTVEDTDLTLEEVKDLFGPTVSTIVDGLTKISGVQFQNDSLQAENFRKVLLTLAQDVRVILDQAGGPAAQHAHAGQHAARQAAEDRQRNALPLRAPRPPPRPL